MPGFLPVLGRRAVLSLAGLTVAGPFAYPVSAAKRKKRRKSIRDARCVSGTSESILSTKPATRRFAQVFEARRTGKLVRVDVSVEKAGDSTGDWFVSIVEVDMDGAPNGSSLGETTIPDEAVPVGVVTLRADFSPAIRVAESKEYGVVVTRPDAATFSVLTRTGNPCGGRLWSRLPTDVAYTITAIPRDLVYATFHKP